MVGEKWGQDATGESFFAARAQSCQWSLAAEYFWCKRGQQRGPGTCFTLWTCPKLAWYSADLEVSIQREARRTWGWCRWVFLHPVVDGKKSRMSPQALPCLSTASVDTCAFLTSGLVFSRGPTTNQGKKEAHCGLSLCCKFTCHTTDIKIKLFRFLYWLLVWGSWLWPESLLKPGIAVICL